MISRNKIAANYRQWLEIINSIVFYGRSHQKTFWLGAAMSVLIVAVRVVLPWLFKWVIDHWLSSETYTAPVWTEPLGVGLSIGMVFLLLVSLLGFADYAARLNFARFSIGAIRDLRSAAFKAFKLTRDENETDNNGDLIARLVGDAARMKAGMKGFLIHVATNSLLLFSISIVLLFTDVGLGLLFVGGFFLVSIITFFITGEIYEKALRYRDKEGQLAEMINQALEKPASHHYANSINDSSGSHEAALTQLQGYATWLAHVVFGITILFTLLFGLAKVDSGLLSNGNLVLFLLYALTVRVPLIQLARQGSRTGKIFACGNRLLHILEEGEAVEHDPPNTNWKKIKLKKIKVWASKLRGKQKRLGSISLKIKRGQHVLIHGRARAGKTVLLEVLANYAIKKQGKRLWDGVKYEQLDKEALDQLILFIEEEPHWPRRPLTKLIGLEGDVASPQELELLQALGLNVLIAKLPGGIETRLTSNDLAPTERKLLGLAIAAFGDYSLILFDNTFSGLTSNKAEALLNILAKARPNATIVVTANKAFAPSFFDKTISLRKGKKVKNGSTATNSETTDNTTE